MLKKIQQLLEERIIKGNKPIAFFFSSKNFETLKDEYCCPECKKGNLIIFQSSSKGLNTS